MGHWEETEVQGAEAKEVIFYSSPASPLPPTPYSPLPTPLAVHLLDKICIDITLQKLWSFHNSLMKPNGGG